MFLVAAVCFFTCRLIDYQLVFDDALANDKSGGNLVKKKVSGFTLIEMLVVLFVISLLLLLFVPKLINQKDSATKKSDAAIAKVVETQIEVFELDHGRTPSKQELIDQGYVKEKQYEAYERNKE